MFTKWKKIQKNKMADININQKIQILLRREKQKKERKRK